jgi:hypothetical protein
MYRKAITFYDSVTERQWPMANWPVADSSLATFTSVPTNNLHLFLSGTKGQCQGCTCCGQETLQQPRVSAGEEGRPVKGNPNQADGCQCVDEIYFFLRCAALF